MSTLEWKPTRKQEKFLSLPLSVKEGFYAGAAGAGKSDVLLMYPIVHEWIKNPNFKGLFLRRTMPELREEIIPRSKNKLRFDLWGGKYNSSYNYWEFKSGAMLFFGHCEHEDDVHNYDSAQWNYIAFDELTSFTEWQYLYLTFERGRRDKIDIDLPAITRSASNPGNTGHAWVKNRFVNPGSNKIVIGKGGNKRIFIPATLADNPHIDPDYSQSLEALPEAEKRAKKYGDWNAYEGQVFEEFRVKHYPDEPEYALHVIPSFDIPEWWPRICVIDWGFSAFNYVSYTTISPYKRAYVYREQAWKRTKIQEWAPYVKEYLDSEDVRIIKVCKSAGQDRGQEHTIQQQIEEALDRPVQLTNNTPGSRIAGKLLLHEYLRWKQKFIPIKEQEVYSEELALWLLRNKDELAYKNYLNRFNQQANEEVLPKLQIFDKSPEGKPIVLLVDAIKSCVYAKTNPEDVAEFDGDDPYDNIRYVVDEVDKYFNEASGELEKIQAREKIVNDFNQYQDWNRLFRQSMALEHKVKSNQLAIRRYH